MTFLSPLVKNILYSLAGFILPLVVTICTVPVYLDTIGEGRFGILSLIWLLFGYFGLFDFGLSRATANRLAQLRGGDPRERAAVFYTALTLNAGFGAFAGVAFYAAAPPLLGYLSTGAGLASEIPPTLPWIAALFPLAMVGGVLTGSLEAEERFLTINIQQIVGAVLMQGLPLAAVLAFGPHLEVAVIGAASARLISVVWNAAVAVQSIAKAGRPTVRWILVPSLLKYGGWVTVTNVVGPLLTSIDQFVIAKMLGTASVAHYSVPFNLATKALLVPGALTRAMFPRLSSLQGQPAGLLADRAIGPLANLMALICAPAILLANAGLILWVGPGFAAAATPVAQALLVGTWINGIAFVPFALLQAQGRPDLVAKFHALEFVPFVLILWAAIATFGLPGAALAWSLRSVLDTGLLFSATGGIRHRIRNIAPAGAVVAAAWAVSALVPMSGLAALATALAFAGCIVGYAVTFDSALKSLAKQIVGRWLHARG